MINETSARLVLGILFLQLRSERIKRPRLSSIAVSHILFRQEIQPDSGNNLRFLQAAFLFESASSESDPPTMASPDAVYTLYYFPFSLYSIMVRFGFEIAASLDPQTSPKYQLKLLNLHEDEEVSEVYLTEVNSKGQVPALTSPSLPAPITDSRDISKWLCDQQPLLVPAEHRETIDRLIEALYAFHAMAVSIPEKDRIHGVPNVAAAMLERSDISEKHRRALEMKSVFHDTNYCRTLEPDNVEQTEALCRAFTSALEEILTLNERPEHQRWLLGGPTIVDAHAVPLISRLLERERTDLVPSAVVAYAKGVMESIEWKRTTHGRGTVFNGKRYGHVRDLEPL